MGTCDGGETWPGNQRKLPQQPTRSGVFKDGPVYEHECKGCNYFLTYAFHGREVDVYKCGDSLLSGTVFRLSNEPSDETTMLEMVVLRLGLDQRAASELHDLAEAKTLSEMNMPGKLTAIKP